MTLIRTYRDKIKFVNQKSLTPTFRLHNNLCELKTKIHKFRKYRQKTGCKLGF